LHKFGHSVVIDVDLLTNLKNVKRITVPLVQEYHRSGIPTFREAQTGLWSRYDPSISLTRRLSENPKLVWEWYKWRQELILTSKPNPAHFAIAAIERFVLTLPDYTEY
jgi:NAD-dependent deacetylase